MGLDLHGGASFRARTLDDVGIERSLTEEVERTQQLGLLLEDADELIANRAPLFFGISDALEPGKEPVSRIDEDELHAKISAKHLAHNFGFIEPQQPVVDEDRR